MTSRVLRALGEIAVHLPVVRRDPLGALDLLTPHNGCRVIANMEYGAHGGQRADLYLPAGSSGSPGGVAVASEPRSAVLFFHGGRWSFGRKEQYRFVAHALAARGHAVAVCDYRKYPDVRFPAFVEDGAAATSWALRHLPEYGVDRRRVFLMGHSAGAHIAALATMDKHYAAAHGYDPDQVAGLVLMSGPFDFFPIKGADLRDIFGPEHLHPETQPLRYVRSGLPPMLILHGRNDRTVHPAGAARFASAVRAHGGDARTIFYNHLTHTNILAALSDRIGFLVAPILEDISRFLQRRLRQIETDAA